MNILKYFKLSLKEVLFSLISSFCIVLGFFSYKVYYYDWYESFFIALKTQNIKHYRLLQFIDKPHLPQEQEHDVFSQEWIEIMTSIQNAFVRAQHSDPDLDLSVELVLSASAEEYYAPIINQWKKDYPSLLNVKTVQDLINEYRAKENLLEVCHHIHHGLCFNLMAFEHIHQPHQTLTMVLSPKMLRLAHPGGKASYFSAFNKKITSDLLLGASIVKNFLKCGWLSAENNIYIESGYLIDSLNDSFWTIFKARLQQIKQEYQEPLKALLMRAELTQRSFKDYQSYLEEKISYWQVHDKMNFNEEGLLSLLGGKLFWLDLNCNGYASYTILNQNFNRELLEDHRRPVLMYYHDMVNLFGQDTAEKVLRFHLIKTDYEFFKAKNTPWIDELKQCRDELWETIDDSAKKYLNQFFRKIALRSLNDGYFEHN